MRRCGKSTVLRLFGEQLLAEGIDRSTIISINFESMGEDYPPLDAKPLYDYVVSRLSAGVNYVFLDEVQHVTNFERVVDGLYVRPDVGLFITGSNAFFLSGELATLLTGRYVEIQVMPLSFAEYHSADTRQNVAEAFNRYLTYGGLPYSLQIEQARDIADYLGGVFNTVIVKDIAVRNPPHGHARLLENNRLPGRQYRKHYVSKEDLRRAHSVRSQDLSHNSSGLYQLA